MVNKVDFVIAISNYSGKDIKVLAKDNDNRYYLESSDYSNTNIVSFKSIDGLIKFYTSNSSTIASLLGDKESCYLVKRSLGEEGITIKHIAINGWKKTATKYRWRL